VGGGGGGGRPAVGDAGLPIPNEDIRLFDVSCDGSSEPKYELRFAGGALKPPGLFGDMVCAPASVNSSPDSDPGPGDAICGSGGGTGRAMWS
jgi:hypothetical protein